MGNNEILQLKAKLTQFTGKANYYRIGGKTLGILLPKGVMRVYKKDSWANAYFWVKSRSATRLKINLFGCCFEGSNTN